MTNLPDTTHPAAASTPTTAENSKPAGFVDDFAVDVPRGRVVGSTANGGIQRGGVDCEGVLSVEGGALRIEALLKPGWGRSGLVYGPYQRANGLAFHALTLNGHIISESSPMPDSFRDRMECWARGNLTTPLSVRMREFLKSGDKRQMWRRVIMWARTSFFAWPFVEENFAIGWFARPVPPFPEREGNAMVMHAVVKDGGELWARSAIESPPTMRGLQSLPLYFTVILREQGAAYYVSALFPNVPEIPQFPNARLVALDCFNTDAKIYAAIYQSVLGQIGFRADSRIFGTQIATLPQLSQWYGAAHAADSLTGADEPLATAEVPASARWIVPHGGLLRTPRGVTGESSLNQAILRMSAPSGFISFLIDVPGQAEHPVGLVWRYQDDENFWCMEVSGTSAQLSIVENGKWSRMPSIAGRHLCPHTVSSLQVFDDGENIRLYVSGTEIYQTTLRDRRLAGATGAGFRLPSATSGDIAIRYFEAHPRQVAIEGLAAFRGPKIEPGQTVVLSDDFVGPAGDHHGQAVTTGNVKWDRAIGRGVFERSGDGTLKVQASPQQPCPGRTAYMVDWVNPEFADIQVTITPPGKRRGTKEKGRSGLIFWQDDDNFLMFSAFVEDWPAMSVAAFFRIGGFEELFDAVWTNVGTRMHWGEAHDLRVVFDGAKFLVYINDEPVLYRALSDVYPGIKNFQIRRVGLIANWEWGFDTGTSFNNFVGRDR